MASYDEAVPPGEAGEIVVRLDTSHLRGHVNRTVKLTTNDPAHELSVLTLRAEVLASVYLLPRDQLSLGSGRGRNQKNRVIVRKDPTEQGELVVSNLSAGEAWLKPTARKVEKEESADGDLPIALPGDWIIEVAFDDESAPSGLVRSNVSFDTGLPREPQKHVPVQVSIIPPVTLRPQTILVSPAEEGEGFRGTVLAVVRKDLDSTALEIEPSSDAIKFEKETAGERHFRIHFSMPESVVADPDAEVIFRVGKGWVQAPIRRDPKATSDSTASP